MHVLDIPHDAAWHAVAARTMVASLDWQRGALLYSVVCQIEDDRLVGVDDTPCGAWQPCQLRTQQH